MRIFWRYRIVFVLATVLTACAQNAPTASTALPTVASIPTITPTEAPTPRQAPTPGIAQNLPKEKASIRIVDAAPDAPTLNVYAGDLAVSTNLAFGRTTEATPIDSGDYAIKLLPIGSSTGDKPLLESKLTINGGDSLLLIITGTGDQLAITSLPDDIQPLNKGESIVRVIHALTGGGAITLQKDGSDITSPVNFGETVDTAILPAGTTSLDFSSGGKKLANYSGDLQERTNYTLILTGHTDEPSVISFTTPAPGRTSVRVINASQKITSVDFYLGNNLLNGKVDFGRPTERQNEVSGQYTLNVFEAGADRSTVQPLLSQIITLDSDQSIALVFMGSAAPFTIVNYHEDLSPTPPDEARVSFLNTLDNLNSVHIETTGGPIPGVSGLIYGEPPTSLLLDTGTFNFYSTAVDSKGVNNTVENATNLQFEPGLSYLYLITGRLDNNPIILSENVGTDSTLVVNTDDNGAPVTPAPGPQIRFVNALQDQSVVDFLVNNESILPGLGAEQGSDLTSITATSATFQVRISGSQDAIPQIDATLENGKRYTVVAYGADKTDVHLLVLPDSDLIFDGVTPHVRLVNLSLDANNELGLGFVDSSQAPAITLPSDPAGQRPFVPSVVQQSLDGIVGGTASGAILMPVGTFSLYVTDPHEGEVAAIVSSLTLGAGAHYDLFAYQPSASKLVHVFSLLYPVRSD